MRNKLLVLTSGLFFYVFSLVAQTSSDSQKVGLILSGGGAKGLAHIGAIKALEEHNVPIDYITGTSMGGVVGGFYAAGYSIEEIEAIATSEAFLTWIKGEIPEEYQYEYLKPPLSPKWLEISLGVDSTFEAEFNPKLANDLSLNYELAEHMAPFDQGPDSDFDDLFVPFKAIGAEVFTQTEVLLDHGNLGAALRATMSVPFVYRPIKIDGKYIFDGGIYDNFPIEPMKEHYAPDVMIGVNVATRIYDEYPEKEADAILSSSLLYMIMDKADPKKLGEKGIYIAPDMTTISGFDFENTRAIIDSGYQATIRQMPKIKEAVSAERSAEELRNKRKAFQEKRHELLFENVVLEGYNSRQQKFIRKSLLTGGKVKDKQEIKQNYYRLAAEPYFSDVFPRMVYNPSSGKYKLKLNSNKKQKIGLQIGGNIASANLSNIFLGARFDYLNNYLFNNYVTGQIGSFHKSFSYQLRMNLAFIKPFYIAPFYDYQRFDFRNVNRFMLPFEKPYVVTDRQYFGFEAGMPLQKRRKLTFQLFGFSHNDQTSLLPNYAQEDTLYRYSYLGAAARVALGYSTLNKKVFPTLGRKLKTSISYQYGGRTTELNEAETSPETIQQALVANFSYEMYFNTAVGAFGFNIDSEISSMNAFDNLQSSLLNAPAYYPTFDSQSKWLPNFRAPIYLALGVKHQFSLGKKFALRSEVHGFKPITRWELASIEENKNGWGNLTPEYALSGMLAFIYETPLGPVSLSGHYYDAEKPWSLMLNIGYLMFKESPLD